MYQQVNVNTYELIGVPGPILDNLIGLTDDALADISAAVVPAPPGLDRMGFWPLVVTPPASFDPKSQVLTDPSSYSADAKNRVVRGQQGTRAMTADELVAANPVPDNPTLGDWRVALTLWGRLNDIETKVQAMAVSSDPTTAVMGQVAVQRLDYSNNVLRAQLLQLKDVFGFTEADVDESLFRAHQVTLGDLSGVWPLP